MEQENFPAQAAAMRRHLGQLSSPTYNDERRLVMELILRLSFDCGRLECPLPDQARLCFITGLSKSSVSRALASFFAFGMIRRRRGADNWTLFEPRPNPSEWGGEGFAWRIHDPASRRAALAAEMALALCDGPGPVEQASLGLVVEPTAREEFQETLAAIQRQEAREQAGALPLTVSADRPHLHRFGHIKETLGRDPVVSPDNSTGSEDGPVVSPDNFAAPVGLRVVSPDNCARGPVVSPDNQLSHQTTAPAAAPVGTRAGVRPGSLVNTFRELPGRPGAVVRQSAPLVPLNMAGWQLLQDLEQFFVEGGEPPFSDKEREHWTFRIRKHPLGVEAAMGDTRRHLRERLRPIIQSRKAWTKKNWTREENDFDHRQAQKAEVAP